LLCLLAQGWLSRHDQFRTFQQVWWQQWFVLLLLLLLLLLLKGQLIGSGAKDQVRSLTG
jgi:hypothetical protein